jgi:3'-5' exoribonuclease
VDRGGGSTAEREQRVKKIFVEQIRERDWVDSPFLVRDKITAMAKNGKPYLTLKLVDRSGEVEGRVWDRVDEFAERFGKDDFIRVQGKASVYLGKMQLVVQDLERLDETMVELADYLPVSSRSSEELEQALRQRVAELRDPHLRALMEAFLADAALLQRLRTAPAAKSMHHVYLGGLLEHSLAVADLADDVCRRYEGLNRDLLVVGALLHDVGKVAELSYERTFDYTDEGKLLGHIVIGVELVEEKLRLLPGFPRPLAVVLKHLLLSHHGQYEFGSPKRPKTLEAVILNFLDDLDSKINGVRTHIEREADNAAGWTSYHRLYDRYFYKNGGGGEPPCPPERPITATTPPAAAEAHPAPAAPRPEKKGAERDRGRQFGFTLADQLRGKSLDLFAADEEKEKE